MNERGCPPDYNGGFCADYDVDCNACWEQWEQEHKANEIFARIASDVVDVGNGMFDGRDITIWMAKDLFCRLCPEEFVLQKELCFCRMMVCDGS